MSYSSLEQFYRLGVVDEAVGHLSTEAQQEVLDSAQDTVDSYLRAAGYGVPLPAQSAPLSIRRAECQIAAWDMLSVPGADPTTDADDTIKERAAAALEWLEGVVAGKIQPIPLTAEGTAADATPEVEEGGAVVVTEPSRGWSYP